MVYNIQNTKCTKQSMIMKVTRENNQVPYKWQPIKIIAEFPKGNVKKGKWLAYSSTSFGKLKMPAQIAIPAKQSVTIKGERKQFQD